MKNSEIIQKINKMDGIKRNKQRYSVIYLITDLFEVIFILTCIVVLFI